MKSQEKEKGMGRQVPETWALRPRPLEGLPPCEESAAFSIARAAVAHCTDAFLPHGEASLLPDGSFLGSPTHSGCREVRMEATGISQMTHGAGGKLCSLPAAAKGDIP